MPNVKGIESMHPITIKIFSIAIPFDPGAVFCEALSNSSINLNDMDSYKYF